MPQTLAMSGLPPPNPSLKYTIVLFWSIFILYKFLYLYKVMKLILRGVIYDYLF